MHEQKQGGWDYDQTNVINHSPRVREESKDSGSWITQPCVGPKCPKSVQQQTASQQQVEELQKAKGVEQEEELDLYE